jgi:predicted phosphodiesterase
MICITGDTHIPIDIDKLDPDNFPEQSQMTKADYVIVCGDFGLI